MIYCLTLIPNKAENKYGVLAWVIMLGIGGAGALLAIFVVLRVHARANARLVAMLERNGFATTQKPTEQQAFEIVQFLAPIVMFEAATSSRHLDWYALKGEPGDQSIVAQHTLVTGSGKHAQTHARTIVCLPLVQRVPEIWLRRRKGQVVRIKGTADVPDVELGDKRIDKPFIIQCPGDPTAPKRLLTPDVQQFILSGPRQESWTLAHGYIACIFGNYVNEAGLRVMLQRADSLRQAWAQKRDRDRKLIFATPLDTRSRSCPSPRGSALLRPAGIATDPTSPASAWRGSSPIFLKSTQPRGVVAQEAAPVHRHGQLVARVERRH